MKLREKLALPFIVLVLVGAACGAAGLLVVSRISSSVATMSEVTSPLLIESMALISNAHEMRSVFQEGTNGFDPKDDVLASLTRLHEEGRARLQRLTGLAARAGLPADLGVVGSVEEQFFSTLRLMTVAHTHKRDAARSVLRLSDAAAIELKAAVAALHEIIAQMEARIIENEEIAKIQVQTGTATSDSLGVLFAQTISEQVWVLQSCYRILRATSQLAASVQRIGSVDALDRINSIEEEMRTTLKALPSLQRKMAGRLRAPQYQATLLQLGGSLERLQSIALGAQGLIAAKRQSLRATGQIDAGTRTLHGIESGYFAILKSVQGTVRGHNEAAKAHASEAAHVGRNVILGLVLISAIFAVSAALFLRRRILIPVNGIAGHMTRIGVRQLSWREDRRCKSFTG